MNDDWVKNIGFLAAIAFIFGVPIFCVVVAVIVEAIKKLRGDKE